MVSEKDVLACVAQVMRDGIQRFSRLVNDLAGEEASLSLYGAITTPSFHQKHHTARSVLVTKQVDLSMLRKLSQHGVQFGKVSIAAPLIMTPRYIQASLDTFPLELIEIQQFRLTLFGEDHFKDLTFDDGHVRLQCEREIKTIQIGLRQGLLAAAGREKFIGALESDTGEGLVRTLRGVLWLKAMRDAKPSAEVLSKVEKLMDRKLSGVRNAMDMDAHHGWDEFEHLYRDVESIQEFVDAM